MRNFIENLKGAFFVSGTDTGIGKTACTGFLARECARAGLRVATQKLIQTGCSGISEDIIEHRRIMGTDIFPEDKDGTTCPYVLSYPASPHVASAVDKVSFNFDKISDCTKRLLEKFDTVFVEGAGGIMVPLTENYLTANYISDKKLPLILVLPSRLGSINHALMSFVACRAFNISLWGVVYNVFEADDSILVNSTRDYLKMVLSRDFPETRFIEMSELSKL